MEKILPLGSIVYLKNSREKIMIVSRGTIYCGNDSDSENYYDYLGCFYPIGLDKNNTIFFNEENIDEVIFVGYSDESESRLVDLYEKWRKETNIPKGII